MIFIARTLEPSRITFGANETQWDGFTPVSTITREARDIRLTLYIPLAMNAFQKLRQKEDEARAGLPKTGISADELRWMSRSKAIEQMQSDDSFLGGQNEMGVALVPPSWVINQGCYLCQGMMGYQPAKSFNENRRQKYINLFE